MKKVLFLLGLLILQIVIIGLIVILAFSFAFFIVLRSAPESPTLFFIGMLLMILDILAIPLLSAIWTYRDVKKFDQGADAGVGWFFALLFFWFPGLSIYLFLRKFQFKINTAI